MEEIEIQPVTIAKMIPLHDSAPVALPTEFVEKSTNKARSAILIFAPFSQILRLIPTRSPRGVKVVVETTELSPDFLLEIEEIFSQNKLKPLYRTGLCFTQEYCTYEGYFDLCEMPISENQLKAEIANLKGVYNVELTKLTP